MKRLQDWLTYQAQRRPETWALVFEEHRTTYGELEQASNRLARALRAAGCKHGDRVALLLPKSTQAIIGIFGVLKAGCVYVPLDVTSPAPRLARMLQVSDCRCILANGSTASRLRETAEQMGSTPVPLIGWLDGGAALESGLTAGFYRGDIFRMPADPMDCRAREIDPAHILFTSGSTGVPKGVMITHSNVIHFVEWAVGYFGINTHDRISGHPPLYFDLSTFDIYGTVAAGAQLHLMPPELSLLPSRLAAFIRKSELTQWFSVPSILNHMAKFDAIQWNDFPSLRRLLWCGEKFPVPGLIHWMRRLPHVGFFNLYGPTEATIASSCYRVPGCPENEMEEIPIGEACDGERLMVLDASMQPVQPGETGDLYIAGAGLSPGYWRDPEKTREVFLSAPGAPGGRIYRTGDLARLGDDGNIYVLGRADSQIKSRGYRIELGEIASAVQGLPGIREAEIVAIEAPGLEGAAICCAYVPQPGSGMTALELRSQLSAILPQYMLPSSWMPLEQMPRNGNGKTDRPNLKEQFRSLANECALQKQAAKEVAYGA